MPKELCELSANSISGILARKGLRAILTEPEIKAFSGQWPLARMILPIPT